MRTPKVLLMAGIAVVAGWIVVFVPLLRAAIAGAGGHNGTMASLVYLVVGIYAIMVARRFSTVSPEGPNLDLSEELDRIVSVIAAATKEQLNVVIFQGKTTWDMLPWKGILSPTFAVFGKLDGKDMIFSRRSVITIQEKGWAFVTTSKTRKCILRIGSRGLVAYIDPFMLQRLLDWKAKGQSESSEN